MNIDWGNFKFKTGVGYYKYDNDKVHQLLAVYNDQSFTPGTEIYNFAYDENGNILEDGNRSFTYGSFDKPIRISNADNSASSVMRYGAERELYFKENCFERNGQKVVEATTYLGAYQKIDRTGGEGNLTEHKYTLGDIVITQRSNGTDATHYLHTDHQGSVLAITDSHGEVVSQAIYDPFGKRTEIHRSGIFDNFVKLADRGYTGHKHSYRIEHAVSLINQTELNWPLERFAYELSFANRVTFSNAFKQIMHCSPSVYKKNQHSSTSTKLV